MDALSSAYQSISSSSFLTAATKPTSKVICLGQQRKSIQSDNGAACVPADDVFLLLIRSLASCSARPTVVRSIGHTYAQPHALHHDELSSGARWNKCSPRSPHSVFVQLAFAGYESVRIGSLLRGYLAAISRLSAHTHTHTRIFMRLNKVSARLLLAEN